MRTCIWLATILGLLPLLSLVALHLLQLAMVHWTQREPNVLIFVGETQISIGSLRPMYLSSKPWPSLLILAGVGAIVCGLWFLAQSPRAPVIDAGDSAVIAPEDSLGNAQEPPGKAEG